MGRRYGAVLLMTTTLLSACGGEVASSGGPEQDDQALRVPYGNGRTLSASAGAIQLANAELAGQVVQGQLTGSTLSVVRPDGVVLSGAALVGARFRTQVPGLLGPVNTFIRVSGTVAVADLTAYNIELYNSLLGYAPVCPNGESAYALRGSWNAAGSFVDSATQFTFGCKRQTLAKCLEAGYRPWAASVGGVPMRDLHQACTRVLRADYCGNGTPNTLDGWGVDMWDTVSMNVRSTSWPLEATWGVGGAQCISLQRLDGLAPGLLVTVRAILQTQCPAKVVPTCESYVSDFSSTATPRVSLMKNAVQPVL